MQVARISADGQPDSKTFWGFGFHHSSPPSLANFSYSPFRSQPRYLLSQSLSWWPNLAQKAPWPPVTDSMVTVHLSDYPVSAARAGMCLSGLLLRLLVCSQVLAKSSPVINIHWSVGWLKGIGSHWGILSRPLLRSVQLTEGREASDQTVVVTRVKIMWAWAKVWVRRVERKKCLWLRR